MRRALLLLPMVFALALPAAAAEELHGVDALNAVLERMAEVQSHLTTLEADFVQHRTSPLLAEPSVSSGRFYFRSPDLVRWDYQKPRTMEVLISDGVVLTYRPSEKRAERVEVGRLQRKIFGFLGNTEPLGTLRRYFSITFRSPKGDGPYTLILEPATYQLKKRIQSVELTIDRKLYVPIALSWADRSGEATSYSFSNIRIDQPLPDETFALTLPDGVAVVDVKLRHGSE